jgi:hypothetical protein
VLTERQARSDSVSDSPARLKRIQQLWIELQATKRDSHEYEELSARIRQEADAFIAAMRTHDARS